MIRDDLGCFSRNPLQCRQSFGRAQIEQRTHVQDAHRRVAVEDATGIPSVQHLLDPVHEAGQVMGVTAVSSMTVTDCFVPARPARSPSPALRRAHTLLASEAETMG